MPVSVTWDDEAKTRVTFTFLGKWTWEEYHRARSEGAQMVKDIPHVVNIIVDYSHSTFFPSNMLSNFESSMKHVPKPFDLAVIVSQSAFVVTMANLAARLFNRFGAKFRAARTLNEARALFAEYDTKAAVKATTPTAV